MTPHGVIEDMRTATRLLGSRLDEAFHPGMWESIEFFLRHCVHFSFGPAKPLAGHQQFAGEMYDRGLFQLPYPQVFYTGDASPKSGFLLMAGKESGLIGVVLGPAFLPDGTALSLPLLGFDVTGDKIETARVDWKSLTTGRHASRKTGKTWEEEDYQNAVEKALSFALGATCMLMSKDVETRPEPVPERLNRKRAQQGRALVGPRVTVLIRPEKVAAYRQADQDDREGRKSPRMHWRRGHFRRVREDLVLPIPPTIVNAAPGAKPALPNYTLGSPRMAG